MSHRDFTSASSEGGPTFYQLLQLDARGLWGLIHCASDAGRKARLLGAMAVRSVLLVAFAILFIGALTSLFGQENSGLAVAGFCILLGIKHVPYGYRAADSVVALGVVYALMVLGGVVSLVGNSVLSIAANFAFSLVILVLVANEPPMGNAGLYMFGYLFVSQTPVEGPTLAGRVVLAAILWVTCSAVLVHKHHGKFSDVRLHHLIEGCSLRNATFAWQLRLAAGVAGVLFVGELLGIPRGVWVGYACMSVLLPYQEESGSSLRRGAQRFAGVVIGSVLFAVFSLLVPAQLRFLFGPIAGICIGFSSKYVVNNVLNCFGALLLAEGVYGLAGSAALRVWDNLVGVLFAIAFTALFAFLADRLGESKAKGGKANPPEE